MQTLRVQVTVTKTYEAEIEVPDAKDDAAVREAIKKMPRDVFSEIDTDVNTEAFSGEYDITGEIQPSTPSGFNL